MKTIRPFLLFGFFICTLLNSCDLNPDAEHNDSALTIAFSDGTVLTEKHIEFYDSSTQTYFLKTKLAAETPLTDFKISVNNDSILGGVFHSCALSSPPPTPYFISDCFFSGRNVLKIGHYGNGENALNDQRIVNSLEENNLYRQGLSCRIDCINVIRSENQTDVISAITITNHDNISYYIPDLNKMGERYYTDYTGGLSFSNTETGVGSFVMDANSDRQRDDIKIDDLALLEGYSDVTYTYRSRNYHAIPKGAYSVSARFMGVVYTAGTFELNRPDGRIWVGEIYCSNDGITIE